MRSPTAVLPKKLPATARHDKQAIHVSPLVVETASLDVPGVYARLATRPGGLTTVEEALSPLVVAGLEAHGAMDVEAVARRGEARLRSAKVSWTSRRARTRMSRPRDGAEAPAILLDEVSERALAVRSPSGAGTVRK